MKHRGLRAGGVLVGFSCGLMLATVAAAQDLPTPTAGSVAIHKRPLVPAQGEETRLIVMGEFPFGNGMTTLDVFEVISELVAVDLSTSWSDGADGPDGAIGMSISSCSRTPSVATIAVSTSTRAGASISPNSFTSWMCSAPDDTVASPVSRLQDMRPSVIDIGSRSG